MSYLIYDAIILVILVAFFLYGCKKGLILTLCSLLGFFVAGFGARMVSVAFTPAVVDWLEPHVSTALEERLSEALTGMMGNSFGGSLDGLLPSDQNGLLSDLLSNLGFRDQLSSIIQSSVLEQTAQATTGLASSLVHAIIQVVSGILLFALAFLVILLLWNLLGRILDLAAHLPVINTLNRTLGGLFGLLQGSLILFFVTWILGLFGDIIPWEVLSQTTLLNFFFNANPLSLITGI